MAAYERGDYATALLLWRPLAEQGIASAQHNLGNVYYNGQGVTQDYAEAAKWWRLAAEQGLGEAQGALGGIYYMGRGVPKNYVLAHMWLNLAVSSLPSSNAKIRDTAKDSRDLVASRLSSAQIAKAQKLAREWKPK